MGVDMRKRTNRLLKIVVVVLVLCNLQGYAFAETYNNKLHNPSFEDGINNWEIIKKFVEPHVDDIVGVDKDMPNKGEKSLHFYAKNDFEFTISQEVIDLHDGYYKVIVWSEGANNIDGSVSVSIKTTDQSIVLGHAENEGWQNWREIVSDEILIDSGKCVVDITVKGAAGYWGHIDDVALVKTRSLIDEERIIISAEAQKINTLINESPVMPDKVRVTYDNDVMGVSGVTWNNIAASSYAQLGEFVVSGKIDGTDIVCDAIVIVGYRSLDLNQDKKTNIIDLAELSYYYGKSKIHMTQTQWDGIKYIDINNDNEINIQDLKIMSNKIR